MTTALTQTAFWARATIKYGIGFVVFLIVARILWGVGVGIYERFNPPQPPPPTVTYGKLPALVFPENESRQNFSFSLELPEVDLPKAPRTLPVYVMPKKSAYFGALDVARGLAKSLRFTKNEESQSPTIYRWTHERGDVNLEMNTITQAFSINSNFYKDEAFATLHAPTQVIAASAVSSFLSTSNLFPKDFTDGKTSTTLIKNEGGNLVLAPSLSEANFIRVDLFRQNYNNFPVVTSHPGKGNVWFLVSGTSDPARTIIAGEYHYFPVEDSQSSTYPIKSSDQAWQELIAGKGVIVSSPGNADSVTVRRAYFAYYDSPEFQAFFQPVFVFEGDNGFVGYVPAVSADYYGE